MAEMTQVSLCGVYCPKLETIGLKMKLALDPGRLQEELGRELTLQNVQYPEVLVVGGQKHMDITFIPQPRLDAALIVRSVSILERRVEIAIRLARALELVVE